MLQPRLNCTFPGLWYVVVLDAHFSPHVLFGCHAARDGNQVVIFKQALGPTYRYLLRFLQSAWCLHIEERQRLDMLVMPHAFAG